MDCNEIGSLIQKKAVLNDIVSENTHKAFSLFNKRLFFMLLSGLVIDFYR